MFFVILTNNLFVFSILLHANHPLFMVYIGPLIFVLLIN